MKAGPCWHWWEPACVRTSSRVAAQALSLLIMENDDILCFYSKQINEHQHTFTCILKWVWILLSWTRRQGTRANVCSWIFNYTFCDADKEALMSNICTHNNIQTKLFANTDLHLGKKKVKAVSEHLASELFSVLFLGNCWEEYAITLLQYGLVSYVF